MAAELTPTPLPPPQTDHRNGAREDDRTGQLLAGPECCNAVRTVIERRRSVRRYSDQKLTPEQLELLLRAGINAPSGSNWQNQRFLVVDDPSEITRIGSARFVWPYQNGAPTRIRESHPGGLLGHAAALILVFVDSKENDRRGMGEYYIWEPLEIQNCAASMQNILLQATAMGLATCWISASDSMNRTRLMSGQSWRTVLQQYDIPGYYKLQGIITVGYPKHVDESGFPIGESKHGATIWQSTARRETEYYTVARKSEVRHPPITLSRWESWKLKLFSKTLKQLLRWTSSLDRRIHRLEIPKVMKDHPQDNNHAKAA